MKRTESSGSRVPPAVTSTRRPSSGPRRAGAGGQLDRGRAARARLGQPAHAPLAARGERARCRARPRARRARAATRGSPEWRGARTCGCSSPARARPGSGRRGRRRSAGCRRAPAASFAIVLARGRRDAVGVAARGELEVADRIVVGRAARPGTRRARGRARTRSTSTGAPVMPSNVARPTKLAARGRLDHAHGVAGLRRKPRELDRLVGGDAAAHPSRILAIVPRPLPGRRVRRGSAT